MKMSAFPLRLSVDPQASYNLSASKWTSVQTETIDPEEAAKGDTPTRWRTICNLQKTSVVTRVEIHGHDPPAILAGMETAALGFD